MSVTDKISEVPLVDSLTTKEKQPLLNSLKVGSNQGGALEKGSWDTARRLFKPLHTHSRTGTLKSSSVLNQ